jgi:rod shape-determining protein MreD
MNPRRRRNWFAPTVSVLVALALSIVPLPEAIAAFRPDCVALVMLYWCLVEPRHYMLLGALVVGLALDTLAGSLFGQHALALLVIVFLSQRFYLLIRTFPASQILLTVIVLLGLYEFLLYWIDGIQSIEMPLVVRWGPVITGALLWLFVLTGIERSRQEAAARM